MEIRHKPENTTSRQVGTISNGMKIVFIGTDRQVFVEGTESRSRIESYTVLAEVVHLIIFTKQSMGFEKTRLAPNVIVYPTNSRTKFGYIFDAIRIAKSFKDVTHVSTQDPFECGIAGVFVSRFHKARFQVQMHIDAFGAYFKRESKLNPLRSLIARFVLPQADCIRPVSERIKRSVEAQRLRLRCDPVVLPVYVDVSRFETGTPIMSLREKYPSYRPLVLVASRLVPQKDIPTALDAFASFVKEVPEAGLVIVGEGPDKDSLQAYAHALGIGDRVKFEPWQKDTLSYLKTADIFLMTSTHEGYQRAIGEAAASGIPIVTTDTGPVGSVFVDNDSVLVCPVGDSECLTKKLVEVATDAQLRSRLVERARVVAHSAIASDYKTYLDTYRALLESCGE